MKGTRESAAKRQLALSPLPNICLVIVTPDSSEVRWVAAVPKPGDRIHGRHPGTWVLVEDVYPSGVATYTVFASRATEGRFDQALERAVDAAERLQVVASPAPRQAFVPTRLRHDLS